MVDFGLKNCWDCPIPLWTVLLQFALLFLAGAFGARMLSKRRPGIRELGIFILVLTVLWAAVVTRTVPRWGILRSDLAFDVFTRRATYLILLVLDSALLFVIFAAKRLAVKGRVRESLHRIRP